MTDLAGADVLVTGGAGFLGRRVVSALRKRGANPLAVRAAEYDLRDPGAVRAALADHRPRFVIHCAAVVGGIGANRAHPAQFFYDNAVMGIHLIHECWKTGVEKMLVVGTVCSYPKITPVPFSEDDLWNGYPEETNAPYGLAKRTLLVQAQAYRDEYGFNCVVVIPTNLYGPGDNADPATSHVIPAIIRKCIEARDAGAGEVVLWGTGIATREFLHVDDAAEALALTLERYDRPDPLNLGTDREISIKDLAGLIAEATGFAGSLTWDASQPDGQPRRRVDATRARDALGWEPRISLEDGLRDVVREFDSTATLH